MIFSSNLDHDEKKNFCEMYPKSDYWFSTHFLTYGRRPCQLCYYNLTDSGTRLDRVLGSTIAWNWINNISSSYCRISFICSALRYCCAAWNNNVLWTDITKTKKDCVINDELKKPIGRLKHTVKCVLYNVRKIWYKGYPQMIIILLCFKHAGYRFLQFIV